MNNRFSVAARSKRVGVFQSLAEIEIVVDLAVEADPNRPIFVRQRLLARAQIDNAQATMPKRPVPPHVQTRGIRSAVFLDIGHSLHDRSVYWRIIEVHETGNSTH